MKIRKVFWLWDYAEEERWLNQMAQDGWVLCEVGLFWYRFEKCEKGEYTVSLQWLEKRPGSKESVDYINFVEDTGAQYIGNVKYWVYFRKKTVDGPLNLIGDTQSQIQHLDRITKITALLAAVVLVAGVINVIIGILGFSMPNLLVGLFDCAMGWWLVNGHRKGKAAQKQLEMQQQLFE